MNIRSLSCLLLSLLCVAPASAAVIDFEDLGVFPGGQLNPADNAVITSGGFDFVNGSLSTIPDLHFPNASPNSISGTTELLAHDDVIMTVTGGGTFALNQFLWGGVFSESGTFTVRGSLSGGGSVSQAFTLDGNTNTLESFALPGTFTNLVSVTFEHIGGIQGTQNIDNIVVNVKDVAEPATMLMLGVGFGLAAYRRTRRP